MTKEIAQKWANQLEITNMDQARESLAKFSGDSITGMCCLAVLGNEVLGMEIDHAENFVFIEGLSPSSGINCVYTLLGDHLNREEQETFISINDAQEKSFSEIAEYIRKTYL